MLSYTHGAHIFKLGGELALDKNIQQTLLNDYGVFSFYRDQDRQCAFGFPDRAAPLEGSTVNGGVQNFRAMWEERGRTDNDRRNVVVASVIWSMDYFGRTNPLLRSVVNGWELSAITTLESGIPFNATTGTDTNLDGTTNDRSNLVGNPFLDPHRGMGAVSAEWFNTAAFASGAAGTDGTLSRDVLISSLFGQIRRASAIRQVQVGLRLTF